MPEEKLAAEAKRIIDAIASRPRFAGSDPEAQTRQFCAAHLRGCGFDAVEREFEFSEWPGRWGIPLVSAAMLCLILVIAAGAARNLHLGGYAFLAVFLLGRRIFKSRRATATATMKWMQRRSANLEAARGSPRVWLVAHLDSKSQTIPMLLRVASHVALFGVLAVEMAMLVAALWGTLTSPPWGWVAVAGCIAALPSLLCFVGNVSQGALDNASGVAAVLLAARLAPPERSLGVLLTSGEELDLAGARAWAAGSPRDVLMVNCDTVDDGGGWRCMHGEGAERIFAAAGRAAKKMGLPLRMGRMIPGIITDSVAFGAAGLPSVTLSRGRLRTLARLHTRWDSPDRVSGAGAATGARLLARMLEELS